MPILKLENGGPYTRDEWQCILENNVVRMIGDGMTLWTEHLSQTRLKASLVQGLEESGCLDMRSEIWKFICRVGNSKGIYSGNVYQKLLLEHDAKANRLIEKDLYRTVAGNEEFMRSPKSGKNRLFNVLKAYTAYDSKTGYCQGMNFVTAMLLRHIADEEEVFWILVYLMCEKNQRDLFANRSPKLMQILKDFGYYL